MQSFTGVTLPIAGCIRAAEEFLGGEVVWRTINMPQTDFMANYYPQLRNLVPLIPELESWASWDIAEINRQIRERGYDIQLQEQPETFAVASILEILVKWKVRGKRTDLRIGRRTFPAAKLTSVEFYNAPGHEVPIVELKTQSDYVVRMMVLEDPRPYSDNQLDLLNLAESLSKDLTPVYAGYDRLIFPMVDLDKQPYLGYFVGMNTRTEQGPFFISEAKQQTRLKMNHIGAKAGSAVAMAVTRGIPRENPYVIDKPFLVWFEKDGHVVFTAWVNKDCWKDPGSLE